MKVGVGAIKGTFEGKVRLTDQEPPEALPHGRRGQGRRPASSAARRSWRCPTSEGGHPRRLRRRRPGRRPHRERGPAHARRRLPHDAGPVLQPDDRAARGPEMSRRRRCARSRIGVRAGRWLGLPRRRGGDGRRPAGECAGPGARPAVALSLPLAVPERGARRRLPDRRRLPGRLLLRRSGARDVARAGAVGPDALPKPVMLLAHRHARRGAVRLRRCVHVQLLLRRPSRAPLGRRARSVLDVDWRRSLRGRRGGARARRPPGVLGARGDHADRAPVGGGTAAGRDRHADPLRSRRPPVLHVASRRRNAGQRAGDGADATSRLTLSHQGRRFTATRRRTLSRPARAVGGEARHALGPIEVADGHGADPRLRSHRIS